VITVIFSLSFVGNLAYWYSSSTDRFCSGLPGAGGGTYYFIAPAVGIVVMGIAIILSALLML
jgi:hypothetical protein